LATDNHEIKPGANDRTPEERRRLSPPVQQDPQRQEADRDAWLLRSRAAWDARAERWDARAQANAAAPDRAADLDRVWEALGLRRGARVLDAGCGSGQYAIALARRGACVTGVDLSPEMIRHARTHTAEVGVEIDWRVSEIARLSDETAAYDAIHARVLLQFVPDVPAALRELRRVLRPGGRLLILDTDWDAVVWHSSDRDRMLRVLEKWNDHLADPYLPRRLPALLRDAGFELASTTIIPILNQGSRTDTLSHGVMPLIAEFVGDQAWKDDLLAMGEDYFFSLNRYVFVAYRS
jgi:arsenite methyltransferase